jgi:phenylacetate-CoA ligase
MKNQPIADVIEQVKDIPIYRQSIAENFFPILEKPAIALDFPDNWMTPRLAAALETGEAEFVLSTGTHHARMQIIRPPYFLLNSYYQLWSEHPDIRFTWQQQCQRVSLTTVLATEHVARMNARKYATHTADMASSAMRRLDARTSYLNQKLDPALWERADIECMLSDIQAARRSHPHGLYHLDCSSYHLAHFVLKVSEFRLKERFPQPASIIHAYEYTPANVRRFLLENFSCPLIDLFGSTELGYLYYSDRYGRYSPYLDKMRLELVPFATSDSIFSLIVSSVRNPYMPLIRYRSGDCVQTADGSTDPEKIVRFCGREKEMLRASHGIVSQADFDDLISAASPTIFVYQLCAVEQSQACLHYTTFDGAPLLRQEAADLQRRIQETTGLDCAISHRGHIAIGKSGKYAWLARPQESACKS